MMKGYTGWFYNSCIIILFYIRKTKKANEERANSSNEEGFCSVAQMRIILRTQKFWVFQYLNMLPETFCF